MIPVEQIIARCKQGDVGAFRRLVDQHQHYAYRLAFRIVCNEDDARDVVQEAFIRVWRNIAGYDPAVRFTTWLYRIVVNLAYDVIRRDATERRLFLHASAVPEPHEEETRSLAADIANRDLAARVKELTEGLPPKQRLVFALRDLQDLDVAEVAEILHMSESSVKANLCYARQHIRRKLGPG